MVLLQAMWEFLITLWCGPRGQFKNLGPKNVCFCLILRKFCDFSGIWDLHYLIFLTKDEVFPEISVLSNIFGFLAANWALNWVHSISAKIQNFEGFLKHCVCLIGRIPLVKTSARSNNIWGSKAQNPQKGPFHRCWSNTKNFENF